MKKRIEKAAPNDLRDSRATKRELPPIVDPLPEPRAATATVPHARYSSGEYCITLPKGENDKRTKPVLAKRTAAGSQAGLARPTSQPPAIQANIRITSINSHQVKLLVNEQPMVLTADDALALANRIIAVLGK